MDLVAVENYSGAGRLLRMCGGLRNKSTVLLTHGTFSNALTMQPLAQFLADAGHDVFVIEWRGRDGNPGSFDFHDLADGEINDAVQAIGRPAHLIGHSGGGLALCFAQLTDKARCLTRSVTLIATQGTHLRGAKLSAYAGIRMIEVCGRRTGYWPARLLNLGPCNESARLLSQWVRFNRERCINNRAGEDIFPKLASLDLPVLGLAGAADTVIARADGCAALVSAFGALATFHVCNLAEDGEDFTHSRLIRSRIAATKVWPRISAFLEDVDSTVNR